MDHEQFTDSFLKNMRDEVRELISTITIHMIENNEPKHYPMGQVSHRVITAFIEAMKQHADPSFDLTDENKQKFYRYEAQCVAEYKADVINELSNTNSDPELIELIKLI